MESMAQLTNEVDFRVAPDDTLSIISSGDKNKQGELLTVGLNLNICTGGNKLKKRILDFTIAILLFMISPVIVLFQKKKDNFFKNIFSVFYGQKTWVGYIEPIDSRILPTIKPGVLPCSGELTENSDADTAEKGKPLLCKKLYLVERFRSNPEKLVQFVRIINSDCLNSIYFP